VAYLGDGLANLLSTALDGAGELRTVDPRSLLSLTSRQGADRSDPTRGRQIAERFGAELYVLGDIVEAGGRLRISASLYNTRRGTAGSSAWSTS
jgi:TolB-like protein